MLNNIDVDILKIHEKILEKMEQEEIKRREMENKINEIDTILTGDVKNNVRLKLENVKRTLVDKLGENDYYYYINDVTHIIHEYKKILNKPVKVSFIGKPVIKSDEKDIIIKRYIDTVRKYKFFENNLGVKTTNYCDNCNNKTFDLIEDSTLKICKECFCEKTMYSPIISYNDGERINMSNKYTYDRKVHFKDCINQYQGKQNSIIKQNVMDELEEEFRKHHLLVEDEMGVNTPREIKFQNITKKHILIFLKELKYTNNYENLNLIHYKFTGIKPPDISHLEEHLLRDFDILTELYDKKFNNLNRKNFINTQYVLMQLLERHRHKCDEDDFVILKTVDRKFFHDEIIKVLFETLGWNYKPFF